MTDLGGITRQFSMEGATHLYSSLPFMLTPADLYCVKDNPAHKAALLGCNIYLIARRHRIYLNPEGFALNGRMEDRDHLRLPRCPNLFDGLPDCHVPRMRSRFGQRYSRPRAD